MDAYKPNPQSKLAQLLETIIQELKTISKILDQLLEQLKKK